jgi:hypothetical protein
VAPIISNWTWAILRGTFVAFGAGSMSITCGVGSGTGLHVGVGIDLACGTSPDDGAGVFALHDQAAKSMKVATAMILGVELTFSFTSSNGSRAVCVGFAFLSVARSRRI